MLLLEVHATHPHSTARLYWSIVRGHVAHLICLHLLDHQETASKLIYIVCISAYGGAACVERLLLPDILRNVTHPRMSDAHSNVASLAVRLSTLPTCFKYTYIGDVLYRGRDVLRRKSLWNSQRRRLLKHAYTSVNSNSMARKASLAGPGSVELD